MPDLYEHSYIVEGERLTVIYKVHCGYVTIEEVLDEDGDPRDIGIANTMNLERSIYQLHQKKELAHG